MMDLLKCIGNSPKLGKMKKNHFLLQPNSRFGSQFGYSSPSLLEANTQKNFCTQNSMAEVDTDGFFNDFGTILSRQKFGVSFKIPFTLPYRYLGLLA